MGTHNLIFNFSWSQETYQGVGNSQHQIPFLARINTLVPTLCICERKIVKISLHVLKQLNGLTRNTQDWKKNFPPRNDMENGQWDNQSPSKIWQQSGQVIDMMDYDSHTQNYAKTSLDVPFLQEIPALATSYPWFILNAVLFKLSFKSYL